MILAPTGSGKTLAAFLWCIHRLMFTPPRNAESGSRVVYISPLKALAVDVERNLRAPLAGIAQLASHDRFSIPTVSIRTGDTPPRDRARFLRRPSEILITTPESLYLLLTSRARESLRNIETVIIDEIHALVPTKRGSHLALSLERLAVLNSTPFQRIGLSATQRPLDEVARFLGGAIHRSSDPCGGVSRDGDVFLSTAGEEIEYRPVTIIDTRERKKIAIRVEMPAQAPLTEPSREDANQERPRAMSIWPAMHPRLLDLIRQHRSTLIFVNSRRLAERLAAALNDLAGEVVARAHHGSLAREQRLEIEERLKAGLLPALVATSSLELGIDMGAIDLVIQIEAPPSVASGLQRIGRASHHIGGVSEGVIVPRHRGDLLACAAVSEAIAEGRIEAVHYPRNPLDVLAQQIVAMVSVDAWDVNELLERIRCSAPFAELPRSLFEGVLDLLSGVYPSEEFTELRPRIVWNRASGRVTARPGAQRLAIANAGTIPDRGLYGVFLAGAEGRAARVGELDEEMVFEARVGEVFALGASTWRIEEITHDRLLVTAAPGEQAKMPFWRGETAQRPFELGQEIGVLLRELQSTEPASAEARLERKAHLDPNAAASLLQYLRDQQHSGAAIPDDRTVIVERCPDELGDWRVFILSPFGGRVHAPWAMVTAARIREELATVVEVMWEDDGFMVRLPQSDEPPDPALFVPDPDQIHPLLMRQLGASAFFAARFRENAARALLLPRRRPGSRTPLWLQRKRASDLLQAASKFSTFPILLETFRECLLDSFDVPALQNLSRRMRSGEVEVRTVDTDRPSPFATSLLFRHVASSIYEGDAPLAERRARALAIDQTQLRELIGEIELRDLLDQEVIDEVEAELGGRADRRLRGPDDLHDLLLRAGDQSPAEIDRWFDSGDARSARSDLERHGRAIEISIAGERRWIAAEDAARYRDALGVQVPPDLPERFLQQIADPLGDILMKYARGCGPFSSAEPAARYGLGTSIVEQTLERLAIAGRLVEGEFRPEGTRREWCERDLLRRIRRRTLARLRHEIEPAEPADYARFLGQWQRVGSRGRGLDALLDVIEILQGFPIPVSILESDILASRLARYSPSDLDTLMAAGEVTWRGLEPVGKSDGRIALFLADSADLLMPARVGTDLASGIENEILLALGQKGALFFSEILDALGGGFPGDVLEAIWSLVWKGRLTNDSVAPLRSMADSGRKSGRAVRFRSRRSSPPTAEGRWRALAPVSNSPTESALATTTQLLTRYGVLTRELLDAERVNGGFASVSPLLRAMEESGRIRRGFFVAGAGAMQFARPEAIERLRENRRSALVTAVTIAASDPSNPYGRVFPWPWDPSGPSPHRGAGAHVVMVEGHPAAWLPAGEETLLINLPESEPERNPQGRAVADQLAGFVERGRRRALLIREIDGVAAGNHPFAPFLLERGFRSTPMGLQLRTGANQTEE